MSTTHQTPEELEADLEHQREQLAATVTQLQARLDVKARARHRAESLRDSVTTETGKPRPELVAAVAAAAGLVVGLVLWRRRR